MKHILVCNEAGGVGKTTFALTFAQGAHLLGHNTLFVNMTKQISFHNWISLIWKNTPNPELPKIVDMPRASAIQEVKSGYSDCDYAVYDTAGSFDGDNWNKFAPILKEADLVVIPINGDPKTIWESEELIELVKRRREMHGKPYSIFFMSKKLQTSTLGDQITSDVKKAGLPIMESFTPQATARYDRLKVDGKTLYHDDFFKEIGFRITRETIELLNNLEANNNVSRLAES